MRCAAAVRPAAVSGDWKEALQQMLVQFTEATLHYTQGWTFHTDPGETFWHCAVVILNIFRYNSQKDIPKKGFVCPSEWLWSSKPHPILLEMNPKEWNLISQAEVAPIFRQANLPSFGTHAVYASLEDWFWADPFLIVQPISRIVNGWISCAK